jgi:phosphoglycolate phosphatase-like HAD superfamily hydrolase
MNPKLLLFDIDGTLISARGIPKRAMATVLSRRYSKFRYDDMYDFSGRTDPEIIEHLLRYDNREFSDTLIKEILREFCIELEKEFIDGQQPEIHPGVEILIQRLRSTENVFLGLVTGNVSEGARIKLEAADLQLYFPIGGFGDDSKDRNQLPPIAKKRAEFHYNKFFEPDNIWIIGDSVHDIGCAQINGLHCLAVSTGRTSKKDLAAVNPEYLEDDLSDVEKIQEILIQD